MSGCDRQRERSRMEPFSLQTISTQNSNTNKQKQRNTKRFITFVVIKYAIARRTHLKDKENTYKHTHTNELILRNYI